MTTNKTFSMVLAMTLNGGIGYQNRLPWKLKEDLQRFKKITTGGIVIMGRKTFESMNSKPLPNRVNVVISKNMKSSNEVQVFPRIEDALQFYNTSHQKLYLIGGKRIFEEGLATDKCSDVHLTRIGVETKCDVYLNKNIFSTFQVNKTSQTKSENGINYDYQHLINKNSHEQSYIDEEHQENQYLDMITKIMKEGVSKDDRTGVGTMSIFGQTMRFNLAQSFPLLTTKKVFFRGVVEELLWFLRGNTNGKLLLDKGVKIWEGNGTREYLDTIGLQHRQEHDLGPVYGFQWRHFGAKYKDCQTDYSNQGVDQVKEIIQLLKNNPDSRRIILSAWNPIDLKQMALPPCHVMSQFFVANGKLSCMMYQRSCDFGLGIPFNIASYALLTYMLAKECNLNLGEFVHVLGDTHIYSNHVEALKKQIERVPYPFPLLKIKGNKSLFDYTYEDFELVGYNAHDKIEMKMAV
ncbi:unnamed protein product (macronuclear) [Paramecium tetraurelia]|uniref:Bifunctional dihydrofolate reductase-thymidylate synthase n=2 Tax=Paramecium tetraurelia TaxID=5888 RepID=DRTS_PARTE|nr:uncharacterized protein GSPATT00019973001 [Paramecium tetraurelia]Q27828.1 RecName: Full=Bifunctional dihydrofolate reductase-thymidylate synthase; Short=DHFR-TS; Includes: RecName: Full=Dihydrofolate reductase; Includes: RecName: Full=Thymidylate synthase [Paramecium tetraurelia]AAC47025.1 dihydrofolate reductase-thymidylate synthase [Paramecium tetraurelia]CAK86280.1 unnamed protein product [Paramecium tetraurelia]|eukprot:XP_001453677.1 hypothetical protein (macronuclear) [Paramecium tetraurelia strain d4-2]